MALIFQRVPIIFTLSSFEYSPIIWKCRGRSPTAEFMRHDWANVVDSTADFLNSGKLSLTKRLHAQFVAVRQFSHWYRLYQA